MKKKFAQNVTIFGILIPPKKFTWTLKNVAQVEKNLPNQVTLNVCAAACQNLLPTVRYFSQEEKKPVGDLLSKAHLLFNS